MRFRDRWREFTSWFWKSGDKLIDGKYWMVKLVLVYLVIIAIIICIGVGCMVTFGGIY